MKYRILIGAIMFLIPILVFGDRYGLCEPPDCGGGGGGGGGGANLLLILFSGILVFGWLGGREWIYVIYGPILLGFIPATIMYWMINDIWPWDYHFSFKHFIGVAFTGYIVGLLILWLIPDKKNKPPET